MSSVSTAKTSAPQQDAPGVAVRPPRLYAAALALGLLLEFFLPASLFDVTWLEPHQRLIGIAISACGFLLLSVCMMEFRKAGTNVPTNLPSETIVDRGPYAVSRNPIYVALTLIYLGLAITMASSWTLALIVPILLVMRYGVIAREENYLEQKFGSAYQSYKRRVGRWL